MAVRADDRYRWWVVFACFVCLLGEAIGSYAFAPLLKPIVEDLGWTRTQFTFSGLFVSLGMAASVPIAGMLADRGFAKRVLIFGALCLGASMALFSTMHSLGELYGITFLMAIGLGCLGGVPATALLSRWFESGRGLAIGLMGLGVNVGGVFLPPFLVAVTLERGWRTAFWDLALGVWLFVLPVIVVVAREAPAGHAAVDPDAIEPFGERLRLRDGIRRTAFWLLATAMLFNILYFAGITVHFIAFATDIGFDAQTAAAAFGALAGVGIVGRLLFGWGADRFGVKGSMLVGLAIALVASLLLQRMNGAGALAAFAVLHGVSAAGIQTVFALLVGQTFGAQNVGTFLGALMLFQVPGGVLGAILAAASFDRLGSYDPAFALFSAGNLVALIAIAALRPAPLPAPIRV